MKVVKSEILGFCFGVRRAVDLAKKALVENNQKKVYSLGPLIHNEFVLDNLKNQGLIIVEENEIEKIEDESVVIIRAHGVSPEVINQLSKKKCVIVDATCPRVKCSQKIVEKNSDSKIFLTGDSNHGEVKGIAGYAKNDFYLIKNEEDAIKVVFENDEKSILLSQTTFSKKEYEKIQKILIEKNPEIKVFNTICSATKERQDSLVELCQIVEAVVVIGGKNSANTIRLYQIAKDNCKNVYHIECEEELPKEVFDFKTVGITAGASTPDELINAIENKLVCGIY
jgi:4-hydroxy-3-methylbut-2-enyl diphosphate reductase